MAPTDVLCSLLQGIFISKFMYGLPLSCDITKGLDDPAMKHLYKLHRFASKAVLHIGPTVHPPDEELFSPSKQKSVLQMCAISTCKLAAQCVPERHVYPLMCDRVEEHQSGKCTRQSSNRTLPPQSTKDTCRSTSQQRHGNGCLRLCTPNGKKVDEKSLLGSGLKNILKPVVYSKLKVRL